MYHVTGLHISNGTRTLSVPWPDASAAALHVAQPGGGWWMGWPPKGWLIKPPNKCRKLCHNLINNVGLVIDNGIDHKWDEWD